MPHVTFKLTHETTVFSTSSGWALGYALLPAYEERIYLGDGRDLMTIAGVMHLHSDGWQEGSSDDWIGGLAYWEEQKLESFGVPEYHPERLEARVRIAPSYISELVAAERSGHGPIAVMAELRALEFGPSPDGNEFEWDVKVDRTKLIESLLFRFDLPSKE